MYIRIRISLSALTTCVQSVKAIGRLRQHISTTNFLNPMKMKIIFHISAVWCFLMISNVSAFFHITDPNVATCQNLIVPDWMDSVFPVNFNHELNQRWAFIRNYLKCRDTMESRNFIIKLTGQPEVYKWIPLFGSGRNTSWKSHLSISKYLLVTLRMFTLQLKPNDDSYLLYLLYNSREFNMCIGGQCKIDRINVEDIDSIFMALKEHYARKALQVGPVISPAPIIINSNDRPYDEVNEESHPLDDTSLSNTIDVGSSSTSDSNFDDLSLLNSNDISSFTNDIVSSYVLDSDDQSWMNTDFSFGTPKLEPLHPVAEVESNGDVTELVLSEIREVKKPKYARRKPSRPTTAQSHRVNKKTASPKRVVTQVANVLEGTLKNSRLTSDITDSNNPLNVACKEAKEFDIALCLNSSVLTNGTEEVGAFVYILHTQSVYEDAITNSTDSKLWNCLVKAQSLGVSVRFKNYHMLKSNPHPTILVKTVIDVNNTGHDLAYLSKVLLRFKMEKSGWGPIKIGSLPKDVLEIVTGDLKTLSADLSRGDGGTMRELSRILTFHPLGRKELINLNGNSYDTVALDVCNTLRGILIPGYVRLFSMQPFDSLGNGYYNIVAKVEYEDYHMAIIKMPDHYSIPRKSPSNETDEYLAEYSHQLYKITTDFEGFNFYAKYGRVNGVLTMLMTGISKSWRGPLKKNMHAERFTIPRHYKKFKNEALLTLNTTFSFSLPDHPFPKPPQVETPYLYNTLYMDIESLDPVQYYMATQFMKSIKNSIPDLGATVEVVHDKYLVLPMLQSSSFHIDVNNFERFNKDYAIILRVYFLLKYYYGDQGFKVTYDNMNNAFAFGMPSTPSILDDDLFINILKISYRRKVIPHSTSFAPDEKCKVLETLMKRYKLVSQKYPAMSGIIDSIYNSSCKSEENTLSLLESIQGMINEVRPSNTDKQ